MRSKHQYPKIHFSSTKKFSLLLISLLLFSASVFLPLHSLYGQKTDSLYARLKLDLHDSDQVITMNLLAFYLRNEKPDSALILAESALAKSQKINFLPGIAKSKHSIADHYRIKNNYAKAIAFSILALEAWDKAIAENKQPSGKAALQPYLKQLLKGRSITLSNTGVIYWNQGNYPKALESILKALSDSELLNEEEETARNLANIGVLYWNMKDYPKALEYSYNGLEKAEKIGNWQLQASVLSNIGNVFFDQQNYEKALDVYKKALQINEKRKDEYQTAIVLGNLASTYGMMGDFERSLEQNFKALEKVKKLNDDIGIAFTLNNIGIMLTTAADSMPGTSDKKILRNKKYSEAEEYLLEGLVISDSIGALDLRNLSHKALSALYSKTGRDSLALHHYMKHVELKDSLFNEERSKEIGKLEAKYDYDKEKAVMDAEHRKELEIAEEKEKRQQVVIFLIAAIALASAVIAFIVFRTLKLTRKQKKVIEEQKRMVEEHQKEITDSIKYASRLQNAILPPEDLIKQHFPESFLMYKPKDIVAGDFYWMSAIAGPQEQENEKTEVLFIAAADCTGHGVPGAMVSVVCSNALNRAVKEFGLRDTGKILDKVTDLVLETFEKSVSEVKDGMDISLLKIERPVANNSSDSVSPGYKAGFDIQWSGANNPLWHVQKGELKEITADKQPVGKFEKRRPFTAHSIEAESDILFFLYTDGLPDQFGGPKGKKFLYKRFKEKLLAISSLPLNEQKMELEREFNAWKGELEQVDDVTVIAVKI